MAMALATHNGFDDDFFAGFPLSAMLTGALRNHDGSSGNRGIPLDVKEVSIPIPNDACIARLLHST